MIDIPLLSFIVLKSIIMMIMNISFQGNTLTGPFNYSEVIDMSSDSSDVTLDGLDGGTSYKIQFSISLYEGNDYKKLKNYQNTQKSLTLGTRFTLLCWLTIDCTCQFFSLLSKAIAFCDPIFLLPHLFKRQRSRGNTNRNQL